MSEEVMKYTVFPFNLTLAKLITEGSVDGRIAVYGSNDTVLGYADWVCQEGDDFKFNVRWFTDTPAETVIPFTANGTNISSDGIIIHLCIEIPVINSQSAKACDAHYHKCKIEPIEYILANNLGFCEGNIVKYITRYKDKGKPLDDLRKIKEYVDYLIKDLNNKTK